MSRKQLLLIRHAKAKQGAPDVDRPLTRRGRIDAQAIGEWMTTHTGVPDLVVVSPSRRTQQTWERIASVLRVSVPVVLDERIYRNRVQDLLEVIQGCDPSVRTLAIVGHNPSAQTLAVGLAGGDGGERERLRLSYPTATVAVFTVGGDWSSLTNGGARLADVVTCRG